MTSISPPILIVTKVTSILPLVLIVTKENSIPPQILAITMVTTLDLKHTDTKILKNFIGSSTDILQLWYNKNDVMFYKLSKIKYILPWSY